MTPIEDLLASIKSDLPRDRQRERGQTDQVLSVLREAYPQLLLITEIRDRLGGTERIQARLADLNQAGWTIRKERRGRCLAYGLASLQQGSPPSPLQIGCDIRVRGGEIQVIPVSCEQEAIASALQAALRRALPTLLLRFGWRAPEPEFEEP